MSRVRQPRAILIAGPTASGKSALALQLACERDGVVVNADSMQVYRELPILTAQPSAKDTARVSHRLYGHVAASEPYSAARWVEDAAAAISEAGAAGRLPIIVGGTGLYFKVLLEGLSPVPPIPAEVRQHWRRIAAEHAAAGRTTALHGELHIRDPQMAARLPAMDTQRVTRALEVIDATGRSLAEWQAMPGARVLDPAECERLVVVLPREALHVRCDRRFDAMVAAGALDEVRALMGQRLSEDAPAMRALGVAPLAAYIAGSITIEEASARAKAETRQYVKRQQTWIKKHMMSWISCVT
ncbi:MAG: tRNA (adenosine(37)-N6)-dimethylallyltransferase MiaA [Hyphomicrobiaceae bacterium]